MKKKKKKNLFLPLIIDSQLTTPLPVTGMF